jgi:catabolite regulation protein CreA
MGALEIVLANNTARCVMKRIKDKKRKAILYAAYSH